jgi:virginiamycin B lyase
VSADGDVTEFPIPSPNAGVGTITLGPDGNIWFTEGRVSRVARITREGHITEIPVGPAIMPIDIAGSRDGGHGSWILSARSALIRSISCAGTHSLSGRSR